MPDMMPDAYFADAIGMWESSVVGVGSFGLEQDASGTRESRTAAEYSSFASNPIQMDAAEPFDLFKAVLTNTVIGTDGFPEIPAISTSGEEQPSARSTLTKSQEPRGGCTCPDGKRTLPDIGSISIRCRRHRIDIDPVSGSVGLLSGWSSDIPFVSQNVPHEVPRNKHALTSDRTDWNGGDYTTCERAIKCQNQTTASPLPVEADRFSSGTNTAQSEMQSSMTVPGHLKCPATETVTKPYQTRRVFSQTLSREAIRKRRADHFQRSTSWPFNNYHNTRSPYTKKEEGLYPCHGCGHSFATFVQFRSHIDGCGNCLVPGNLSTSIRCDRSEDISMYACSSENGTTDTVAAVSDPTCGVMMKNSDSMITSDDAVQSYKGIHSNRDIGSGDVSTDLPESNDIIILDSDDECSGWELSIPPHLDIDEESGSGKVAQDMGITPKTHIKFGSNSNSAIEGPWGNFEAVGVVDDAIAHNCPSGTRVTGDGSSSSANSLQFETEQRSKERSPVVQVDRSAECSLSVPNCERSHNRPYANAACSEGITSSTIEHTVSDSMPIFMADSSVNITNVNLSCTSDAVETTTEPRPITPDMRPTSEHSGQLTNVVAASALLTFSVTQGTPPALHVPNSDSMNGIVTGSNPSTSAPNSPIYVARSRAWHCTYDDIIRHKKDRPLLDQLIWIQNKAIRGRFKLRSEYIRAYRRRSGPYTIYCPECNDHMRTVTEYLYHCVLKHGRLICHECGQYFIHIELLLLHRKDHDPEHTEPINRKEHTIHKSKSFFCHICRMSMDTGAKAAHLKFHLISRDEARQYIGHSRQFDNTVTCKVCREVLRSVHDYFIHCFSVHTSVICHDCGIPYHNLESLLQHRKSKHK